MNYEPSSGEGKVTTDSLNRKVTKSNLTPKSSKTNSLSKIKESTHLTKWSSTHQPQWFWNQHLQWSYLQRGLFWGTIVSFIAIFSAGCGVVLTKIEGVEKAIAQQIDVNPQPKPKTSRSIATPLNVLLVELDASTKNKNILLLKVDPQIGFAKVINIPADSRVDLSGYGWMTIADAYRHGGTDLTSRAAEQLINVKIDRYLMATTDTLAQLTASGKLTLNDCNPKIQDCISTSELIQRQEAEFESIHQRLNVAAYFANFTQTVEEIHSDLESNISVDEFVGIATFVKQLKQERFSIGFLATQAASKASSSNYSANNFTSSKSETSVSGARNLAVDSPIAVQNTTTRPELGMQVVNYLRQQNFQNVYLVGHIPLKLTQTKIIADRQQLHRANNLKNALGFGNLKPAIDDKPEEITIKIGNDADRLLSN